MTPRILITAGLENTKKGIFQLHAYQNYGEVIARSGGIPLLAGTKEEYILDQMADFADGLFLTGGEDIACERYGQKNEGYCGAPDIWRDDLEWKLCERFVQRKKPILGICRGLQLLNVYFGGTLVQDLEKNKKIIHPYNTRHIVSADEGSWFYHNYGSDFVVNSYHHQSIDELGVGLLAVVTSENHQIIEAIEHESLPIVAVQWHPERMTGQERYDLDGPDMKLCFDRFCQLCIERKIYE